MANFIVAIEITDLKIGILTSNGNTEFLVGSIANEGLSQFIFSYNICSRYVFLGLFKPGAEALGYIWKSLHD
jgi:hypothetical protein